jgi:hypothetical protein
MEMSPKNLSYPKQTKMSFFFFQLQNQRTGGQKRTCLGGGGTKGKGEEVGKGRGRVTGANTVYTGM